MANAVILILVIGYCLFLIYGFGAFLVIYLAGVLIYQVVLWIQKWKRKKKDGEQENG